MAEKDIDHFYWEMYTLYTTHFETNTFLHFSLRSESNKNFYYKINYSNYIII